MICMCPSSPALGYATIYVYCVVTEDLLLMVTLFRYRKRGGADYGYPGAKRGRGGRGRFHGRPHGQDRRSGERSLHPSESLDGNSECTLDQLTNSLAKDTGVTGHSSSQVTAYCLSCG